MRKPKSLLETLGVKSIKTIAHGEISIVRAIQACALAAVISASITLTHVGEIKEQQLFDAQAAEAAITHYDRDSGQIADMILVVDTATGEAGYAHRGMFRLDSEFKQALEAEISAITAQVEVAGSWDLYIGARLTNMYLSEDPFERQVANATLRFIETHTEYSPAELPKAAHYTRAHAAEIESARQVFIMADAMSEALISEDNSRINRAAAERALEEVSDTPDAFLLAFNIANTQDSTQANRHNILPLVERAVQIKSAGLSLASMSGQMFGITEVAEEPAMAALMLSRRLGVPVPVRKHSGSFAEHYDATQKEPTDAILNAKIKTGFDLQKGLSVEGRGALLTELPMALTHRTAVPDVSMDVKQAAKVDDRLFAPEIAYTEDSFKVSM